MSGLTVATYFSGGGLSDIGAALAGFSHALAVEYNPNPKIGQTDAIAQVYADNLCVGKVGHIRCEPVQCVPESVLRSIEGVDLFMFSPPCIRASVANSQGGEQPIDMELAQAVCRAIRLSRPRSVMVENVIGYRSFAAFKLICDTLDELGYWWQADNLNSADFGVPQTRRRLILRAVRDGYLLPLQPTHREGGGNGLKPWVGWYAAIEDLLPDCLESKLAAWQERRLPEALRTLLVGAGGFDGTVVQSSPKDPAFCLTANQNQANQLRAVLVGDQSATHDGIGVQTASPRTPAFAVRAKGSGGASPRAILCGVNGEDYHPRDAEAPAASVVANHAAGKIRAVTLSPSVRVVALTLRCLARFQSMPDWYRFPAKKSLGCVIVGNGIPVLLAQAIAANLRDSLLTG